MHPNGQLPAYEWAFNDVNPPVHAWAAWRVYKIDGARTGKKDTEFLERIFHKLLINFAWWVNRKDSEGLNVFEGGFLGLDNIGLFDRSAPLPDGGRLAQSDATSWMAMYCLNMLAIALELAQQNRAYEDVATKFFEHFLYIAHAANNLGGEGLSLWDDDDGFFYDVLRINGPDHPSESPLLRRAHPALRRRAHRAEGVRHAPRLRRTREVVPEEPTRPVLEHLHDGPSGFRRASADVARRPRPAASHPRPHARRARVPVGERAALSLEGPRDAPCLADARRPRLLAWATSPASPRPACSAATRTGGARCGSP